MNEFIFGALMVFFAYIAYAAAAVRHEQKKLWRQGKADYFGNPRNKCMGGEEDDRT